MKNSRILFLILFPMFVFGQNTKEIRMQTQTWFGLGTNFKVSEHWGFIVDGQMRRDHFLSHYNFYLVRGGISYIANPKCSFTLGYAHQWNAPSQPEWNTIANENRIYQQAIWSSPLGTTMMMQRIRNEQRWQEKIANDQRTGIRFTNRIRYQLAFNIPIFKKKTMPTLLLSDEILFHFGKEVVYNTFDQNRVFVGIKQVINPQWSFDLGYMNVYQQKYSGYQYDDNHTLRLFFYYNSNLHTESGD